MTETGEDVRALVAAIDQAEQATLRVLVETMDPPLNPPRTRHPQATRSGTPQATRKPPASHPQPATPPATKPATRHPAR